MTARLEGVSSIPAELRGQRSYYTRRKDFFQQLFLTPLNLKVNPGMKIFAPAFRHCFALSCLLQSTVSIFFFDFVLHSIGFTHRICDLPDDLKYLLTALSLLHCQSLE